MITLLTYDDFPAHSTILREQRGEALHITIPASEPDAAALATARMHTALPAALWTVGGIAIAAIPFIAMVREIRGRFPTSAGTAFAVLVAAVFALLWRTLYQRRRDELEKVWERAMVIVVRDGEVLIEADDASITLSNAKQRAIVLDDGGMFWTRLPRLIVTEGDNTFELLVGRHVRELNWVGQRMAAAMHTTLS